MARIKLQMPDNYQFATTIDVRITDLNYGNHLANDSLLSIIHEARVRFLNNFGYSEIDVEGFGIMMADSVIIYKSQSYYGDSFLCKTAIVFYDYHSQKPARIPEPFLEKILLRRNTEGEGIK
jgi:acyl-CoA thioesterase FadM